MEMGLRFVEIQPEGKRRMTAEEFLRGKTLTLVRKTWIRQGENAMFFYTGYGLIIIGLLISLIASWNVNATFKRYSNTRNSRGITASQVARQILDDNGLYQVTIERVSGNLTDHYDPRANVVRLSDATYSSTSTAAIGVAAHECGHAVQHAQGYVPIKIRSAVIPVTQIGSRLWYIVFFAGVGAWQFLCRLYAAIGGHCPVFTDRCVPVGDAAGGI